MGFQDRLKEQRENIGMSRTELADILGVTPAAIGNYENGISTPKADILFKVFDALKCDANYLFQDEMNDIDKPFIISFKEKKHIKKYRSLDEHGTTIVDLVLNEEYSRSLTIKETDEQDEANLLQFPVSPSKASAGSGYLLFDEEPDEIWNVVSNSETRKADIGITVSGDSMEPLYYDSDVLLVRKQPDINIGEIGIFIKDGQGYVKKKGNDRLISINKSRSDIYPSENEEILCFGKVIGKLKPEWVIRK